MISVCLIDPSLPFLKRKGLEFGEVPWTAVLEKLPHELGLVSPHNAIDDYNKIVEVFGQREIKATFLIEKVEITEEMPAILFLDLQKHKAIILFDSRYGGIIIQMGLYPLLPILIAN